MKKARLFAAPTQTTRDIANLLSDPDELQPEMSGTIEMVTLSRIQLDPLNPRKLGLDPEDPARIDPKDPERERKEAELEALRLLAATIQEHGIMEEPGVYRRGDNYALIWGERRVLASRLLKHETIAVKILPERPKNVREKQLIENMQRSDLSLAERVRGLKQAREEHADGSKRFDADYLQRTLGLKKSMAYYYLALCTAPPDVIAAIDSGILTGVEQAATIAGIADAGERKKAIALLDGDATQVSPAAPVKTPVVKPASRGRPVTSINLGKTKSASVARFIAEKVLDPKEFAPMQSANWDDLKVASDLLKQVIKKLEQRLAKT